MGPCNHMFFAQHSMFLTHSFGLSWGLDEITIGAGMASLSEVCRVTCQHKGNLHPGEAQRDVIVWAIGAQLSSRQIRWDIHHFLCSKPQLHYRNAVQIVACSKDNVNSAHTDQADSLGTLAERTEWSKNALNWTDKESGWITFADVCRISTKPICFLGYLYLMDPYGTVPCNSTQHMLYKSCPAAPSTLEKFGPAFLKSERRTGCEDDWWLIHDPTQTKAGWIPCEENCALSLMWWNLRQCCEHNNSQKEGSRSMAEGHPNIPQWDKTLINRHYISRPFGLTLIPDNRQAALTGNMFWHVFATFFLTNHSPTAHGSMNRSWVLTNLQSLVNFDFLRVL